jgi:Domain of unknown function (DUF1707)
MSTQPTQVSPRPAAGGPDTRASDADRDAAVGLLNEAFATGRLTAAEHDQRLGAAYAARTWQQLRQLTMDLPAPPAVAEPAAPAMFTAPDVCLLCVLLIVCPPAGIAWWLLSRRRSGTDPVAQRTPAPGSAVAPEPQPGRPVGLC